jgi:mono/diheme cytochrome c family protein
MRNFVAGVVAAIVCAALAGLAGVWFGLIPAAADAPRPSRFESWAAHHALAATIDREQPAPPYPYGPATDAVLLAGAKLYQSNCAVCHGSAGSPQSNIAKGLYVHAPQFTKHGVDDDPTGETYWKIEHGIRFTGMPSFKGALGEEQIWQIAYFLKRRAAELPPAAAAVWKQPHGD